MSHCLHPCTFNKDTITTALCLCVLGLGIGGPREGWVASPHPSEWRDLLVGLAVEVGRGHWLWGPWLLSRAMLTGMSHPNLGPAELNTILKLVAGPRGQSSACHLPMPANLGWGVRVCEANHGSWISLKDFFWGRINSSWLCHHDCLGFDLGCCGS